jgi:hypothetical protein
MLYSVPLALLGYGVNPLAVRRRQEVTLKKSTGYDPDHRLAAALIAHAIKTARKIERPNNHAIRVRALSAIAWLARPEAADPWFDMAGFEYKAAVERLPLDRWIARGRELLASDPHLREAVTRATDAGRRRGCKHGRAETTTLSRNGTKAPPRSVSASAGR